MNSSALTPGTDRCRSSSTKCIEEDERTRLYVNHEGILMREFKEHADTSMPQFVKFPVETAEEFEEFAAERLALNAEQRLNDTWKKQVATGQLHAVAGAANTTAVSGDVRRGNPGR